MEKDTVAFVRGNTIQLVRVKHARTFGERFMGLMGVSPREHHYAVVFHMAHEGRMSASIHMLFMRMPIDVLFLNGQRGVVDVVEGLTPWVLNYTPVRPAKYVVEFPARTLSSLLRGKKQSDLSVKW